MAITEICMNDICDSLKDVLCEKSTAYDLSLGEMLEIVFAFAFGIEAQVKYATEPEKYPELKKYIIEPEDMQLDIPDDLSELEDE